MFSRSSLFGLVKNTIWNVRGIGNWFADRSFNWFDAARVKEIGPNLACAEWLMMNGAKVRCVGYEGFVNHCLPTGAEFKIKQVYAGEEACISQSGFLHFKGCKNISDVSFVKCETINDEALYRLRFLKDSLTSLEIDGCINVSEDGIIQLQRLQALKHLELNNIEMDNELYIINRLKSKLKNCNIV